MIEQFWHRMNNAPWPEKLWWWGFSILAFTMFTSITIFMFLVMFKATAKILGEVI